MKKCKKCGIEKDNIYFDKTRQQCKDCRKSMVKTWTWQIDHIVPQSEFDFTLMSDKSFSECWALSNLRPYSSKNNIQDGARRVRHGGSNF